MAARSSQDLAGCWRAMARACWKQASASSHGGLGPCRRSSAPLREGFKEAATYSEARRTLTAGIREYAMCSPLPPEPVADRASHPQLEVAAPEPRQLLGEQGHALAPRAGHARDVGPPEPARGAEGVIELLELVVHVAERVGLIGVARRAGGLHGYVGILRERQHLWEIRPPLGRARHSRGAAEMIEDQLEVRMPLRHLAD